MTHSHKISHFLHTAQPLQPLAQQVQHVSELQPVLTQLLPPQLRQSIRVGHWEAATLFLTTNNGAIAAKLKQLVPELLFQLQKQGHKFTLIRIGVQVEQTNPGSADHSGHDIGDLAPWRILSEHLDTGTLKSAVQTLLRRRRDNS